MLTAEIIKFRDKVKGRCKIQVIGDNGENFIDGVEGNALLWLDDKQTLMVVRPNIASNQAATNFEITLLDYDHIQYMRIFANQDILKEILDMSGHPNKDKAYKMLSTSDVTKASTTGATGDGIYYGHTMPLFNSDLEPKPPVKPSEGETENS